MQQDSDDDDDGGAGGGVGRGHGAGVVVGGGDGVVVVDGGGDIEAAENCAKITWFFLIIFLATLGVRPVLTFVRIFQH